ncbi:uncharacterized protein LOC124832408 [Vigna umbellata]|uniref:uncharacterized protein LOC124832408 n=1 Tax=Vigna umbellata TaxID=87088 RepID=UPI001F5E92E1|nr:uncharacterized protein LOC124832408 [Vigna umbellata]
MDVTFVLEDKTEFCIRVESSNKFQEIKEKIKISRNIPVDRQTLLFNGQVFQNEALFIDTHISQLSRVPQLVQPNENEYDLPQWIRNVSKLDIQEMQEMLSSIPEAQNMSFTVDASVVLTENPDEIEEFVSSMMDTPPEEPVPQFPLPNTVMFMVKSLDVKRKPLPVEMYLKDTVLQLKEVFIRTKKPRRLKVKNMVVVNKVGDELHDHMSMLACGMLNVSHVYVCSRSERGALIAVDLKHGKMLKVMVVPKGRIQKIPIEVNSLNCLGDLRFELEKFHKHFLPESFGYFFTIKNGLLASETYSFDRLGIKEGDTVIINPKQLSSVFQW